MVDSREWCSFDAGENFSLTVYQFFLFVLFIVLISWGIAVWKHYREKTLRSLMFLYEVMLMWIVCFIVGVCINISAYYEFMLQKSAYDSDQIKVWSIVYSLFVNLATFALLTLMIDIPHRWITNTLEKISFDLIKVNNRIWVSRFFRLINQIQKYRKIRLVIPVIFVSNSIFSLISGYSGILPIINTAMLTFQSCIIFGIYMMGFVFMSRFGQLLGNMEKINTIKRQYVILSVTCVIRLINNILTYFSAQFNRRMNENCFDQTGGEQNIINNVLLLISLLLMHLMPIICVLLSYWPLQGFNRDSNLSQSRALMDD